MEHEAPKNGEQKNYGSAEYWDKRYGTHPKTFEWLESWSTLRSHLLKDLTQGASVLNVGCGTSNIEHQLLEQTLVKEVTCIDISQVLISQKKDAQRVRYLTMDAREMNFPDGCFDVILDKSTLDSLLCGAATDASRYLRQASRVLKPKGIIIIVSYGHPQQRMRLLGEFNVTYEQLGESHFLYQCRAPGVEQRKQLEQQDLMEM